MRAYHRIVGDPPRRGFGSDIASVGFPGGNWAAGVTGRRLPPVDGVPFFDEQRRDQDALSEIQCAYELQALDFQKVAVVYSAEGMLLRNGRVEGRPHGYSDIVALTGDGPDTALTSGSPRDWLSYSGFLTLGAFWALAPQMESIEAESWTPSSFCAGVLQAAKVPPLITDEPPKAAIFSSSRTLAPVSAAVMAAVRPARPLPTTMTSTVSSHLMPSRAFFGAAACASGVPSMTPAARPFPRKLRRSFERTPDLSLSPMISPFNPATPNIEVRFSLDEGRYKGVNRKAGSVTKALLLLCLANRGKVQSQSIM